MGRRLQRVLGWKVAPSLSLYAFRATGWKFRLQSDHKSKTPPSGKERRKGGATLCNPTTRVGPDASSGRASQARLTIVLETCIGENDSAMLRIAGRVRAPAPT